MKKWIVLLISVYALISANEASAKASDIKVEDFFKTAKYSSLKLSPDGKKLAVLTPVSNRRNIAIMDTDGLKNIRLVTGLKERDIGGFFWANNEDILFTIESDGTEAFSLYKVDTTKKIPKVVEIVGSSAGSSGIRTASVVHLLPDEPDHIIVQYNGRRIKSPDLYKLNINSRWNNKKRKNSKMKLIAKNPGDIQGWILDNAGDVRGAVSTEGLKGKLLYKDKDASKFTVIKEFNPLDENISPLAYDFDNKMMYAASNVGRDKSAIYMYNPKTGELGDLIYANDDVDVTGLMMSSHQEKFIGITYTDDYTHAVYFDKPSEKLMKGLEKAFPGKKVSVSSQSKDENLKVLLVNDDTDPGVYYLYNHKKKDVRHLLSRMSWLNPEEMSDMKPIKLESRDGLTLHGYLTIPKESNGKKLPLIINPP